MQILYQSVKGRAEPESKAVDLAVDLRSYHHPWAVGTEQKFASDECLGSSLLIQKGLREKLLLDTPKGGGSGIWKGWLLGTKDWYGIGMSYQEETPSSSRAN